MKKQKSTLRALLASTLVLIMCMSMLIGTTFAWFTDSVSSVNNIITAGNLDVVLEYSTDGTTWAEVKEDTKLFGTKDLWEPGHTEVVALRAKNAGTLAMKYVLSTSIYLEKEGTNVYGETFKLSDHLEVYTTPALGKPEAGDEWIMEYMTNLMFNNRDDIVNGSTAMAKAAFNTDLVNQDLLLPGDEQTIFVAITMPTTVGNEANYKTGTTAPYIRFGVDLIATQVPHEEDSFGKDYDEGAKLEGYPVAIVTDNGPVEDLYVESLFGGGMFDENNNEHLRDMDATYTFKAPEGETAYDEWIADYEVSVVTPDGAKLPEGAIVMAGQYNIIDPDWQAFYTPEVESGMTYRLLGAFNLYMTYDNIKNVVGEFNCGVENVNAPAGTVMTVALKLYKQDANNKVLDEHTVGLFTYTFE